MGNVTLTIAGMDSGDDLTMALRECGPVTLPELRELLRLDAAMAAQGGTCPVRVAADQPVTVGGVVQLYLPTLAARDLCREAREWFAPVEGMVTLARAYILAHGRDREALRALTDKAAAERIIGEWARRLPVRLEELDAAIAAAFDGFPDVIAPDVKAYGGWLVAHSMAAEYGGTGWGWYWEASLQSVAWLQRERRNADAGSDSVAPGLLETLVVFQRLVKSIKDRNAAGGAA